MKRWTNCSRHRLDRTRAGDGAAVRETPAGRFIITISPVSRRSDPHRRIGQAIPPKSATYFGNLTDDGYYDATTAPYPI